eukprot:856583-Amphidinium_carterae.1
MRTKHKISLALILWHWQFCVARFSNVKVVTYCSDLLPGWARRTLMGNRTFSTMGIPFEAAHECTQDFDTNDFPVCGPRYVSAIDSVISQRREKNVVLLSTVQFQCHSLHVLRAADAGVPVFLYRNMDSKHWLPELYLNSTTALVVEFGPDYATGVAF